MEHLLYLPHRIPYPPNKGDKLRSYHLLKYLSQRYRVHLGTFVDAAEDWQHVDSVKALCGETYFARLAPSAAKLRSLAGFLRAQPLSLPYYRDRGLQAWVEQMLKFAPLKRILVFSSPMAQYVARSRNTTRVIDFVDVDSDKWRQYASTKRGLMKWIYAREADKLLEFERSTAANFDASVFVTAAEARLFQSLVPECAAKITHANNGVDTEFFAPNRQFASPYQADEVVAVFTGAMDYWPNVDAVVWFAQEVFASLQKSLPRLRFYIVGARPTPAVKALAAQPAIVVTGTVPDVRPYIAHASVALAPLRIARGTQNKVLEAMAMGKTVIASREAGAGVSAHEGTEIVIADGADAFSRAVRAMIDSPLREQIGQRARNRVLADYSWDSNLERIAALLGAAEADSAFARSQGAAAARRVRPGAR